MSASLVGSEMCIRDRLEVCGLLLGGALAPAAQPGPRGILEPRAQAAVSYTHLTLPTICSV
eukprot:11766680-Alexandrium_andersonii.AAC.1